MAAAMASTKKDQSLCIHCKKKVHPTDMLQCYDCKSWVHYECTELKIPREDFPVKYCVKIPDAFSEKVKQIISSKNSSEDSSNKASIDKLSQLETQIETLHDEKTVSITKYTRSKRRYASIV